MNKIRKRTVLYSGIFVALLIILVVRILYWQVIRGPELRARGESQQTASTNVAADRGTIYDRNGKVLAVADAKVQGARVTAKLGKLTPGKAEVTVTLYNSKDKKIYGVQTMPVLIVGKEQMPSYACTVDRLGRAIVNGKPYPVLIDEGVEVVRITEEALKASGYQPHESLL